MAEGPAPGSGRGEDPAGRGPDPAVLAGQRGDSPKAGRWTGRCPAPA